jgi:hypothetical protein
MADGKLNLHLLDGVPSGERVTVLKGVLNAETAFHFMTRVQYVDSGGLGVLIGAYVSFERSCRRLVLAGLNDQVWVKA